MGTEIVKRNSLLPVYLVFFVDNFGFSLVFTLFGPLLLDPQYQMLSSDVTVSMRNLFIGILFSIFPLAQLFGAPFVGDLADHFGRKKAFYLTLAGSVVAYILSGFSVMAHSYALLLVSRLLCGFFAGNLGICLAAIADLSPTERSRGRQYGMIAMTAGISWISAMIAGSYLSDSRVFHLFNPAIPFLLSAVFNLISLIAIIFFFHETRIIKDKPLEFHVLRGFKNILTAFKIPDLRILYVIYLAWIIGWGAVIQWFTPFSIERFEISQEEIAWILVLFGISWSFGGAIMNYLLLRRFTSKVVSMLCLVITLGLVAICALSYHYVVFCVAFILAAAFGGVVMSNLLNLISLSAPYHMQGKVMGLSQSTIALGWIIGPVFGGLVAEYSINDIYYFSTLFIFIAVVLLVIHNQLAKRRRRV
jgi:predicted MFS family arabinose efflux permease